MVKMIDGNWMPRVLLEWHCVMSCQTVAMLFQGNIQITCPDVTRHL